MAPPEDLKARLPLNCEFSTIKKLSSYAFQFNAPPMAAVEYQKFVPFIIKTSLTMLAKPPETKLRFGLNKVLF